MAAEDAGARHTGMSRVATLARLPFSSMVNTHVILVQSTAAEPKEAALPQRGMKNIVTLNRLVKYASCLNMYSLVHEDKGHHAHELVAGCSSTAEGHQSSYKGKGKGKDRGKCKFDKDKNDGEDDKGKGKGKCNQGVMDW